MTDNTPAVRREILTYLGTLPRQIQIEGLNAHEIALALGNCLLWVSGWIDDKGPQAEQPLPETPQSVHALGKQFRAVALHHLDKQSQGRERSALEYLESRLYALEQQVSQHPSFSRQTVEPEKDAAFEPPPVRRPARTQSNQLGRKLSGKRGAL